MNHLNKFAQAVQIFGFGAVASEYIKQGGEEAPVEWDLRSTLEHIGTKIAMQMERAAQVRAGVDAFKELCPNEKIAEPLSFTAEFHGVNFLATRMDKTASDGFRETLSGKQLALWNRMKEAASLTKDPVAQLAKMAIQVWSETERTGDKTASTRDEREAYAISFAANYNVDQKIAALNIDERSRAKLAALSAEAAMDDLSKVVKVALHPLLTDPRVVGAAIGAVGGAGMGAWDDKDNRLRGAGMGALMGAPLGAAGGQLVHEYQQHGSDVNDHASKMKAQAQDMYNRVMLGGAIQKPKVLQAIHDRSSGLIDHFSQGGNNLPVDLLKDLTPDEIDQLHKNIAGLSQKIR